MTDILDKLDRKASLAMALGGDCVVSITPQELRNAVKAMRRIEAAKAAYCEARKRIERTEVSLLYGLWQALAATAFVAAMSSLAGILP